MCGIVGYAGVSGATSASLLCSMRDALSTRGPDAAGLWTSDDGSVLLGHRRLAIIDLSPTGAQPMESSRRTAVIVFNGEIYNHEELRSELTSRGARFVGRSDTEVLLAAYDAWGEGCVERIRGMFAFGIYDLARRRMFLARDRAGEKPLFWTKHRQGLIFTSELKALMTDGEFRRQLSPEALGYYLSFGYVPGDQCILQGVQKLPPAHCLTWNIGDAAPRIWQYWQLPSPQPGAEEPAEVLGTELQRLLTASVKEQLVADVPLAVLLSGGVDSSVIAAVAAQAASGRIRTFTVTLPGHPDLDESRYAGAVASHLGTDHVELPLDQSSMDLLQILSVQYDEPIADSSMIPTYLLSRTVRQHCTVVLGGDGGDELFGGYRSYQSVIQRDRMQRLIPAGLRSFMAAVASNLPAGTKGRNYALALRGDLRDSVTQSAIWNDSAVLRRLSPWLGQHLPHFAAKSWRRNLVEPQRGIPGAAMAADFASYLPEDILVKVDRAGMLCSLEVRAPFLDQRVIEFAFSRVPNRLRTTARGRKILLKSVARRLLPPALDLDRKQGFSIPLVQWLSPKVLKDWLDACNEQIAAILSPKAVHRLVYSQRNSMANERLFGLIVLTTWMRHYRVSA